MFDWLFNLFPYRRDAGRHGPIAKELPARSFPNPGTISGWGDQGLFVATGCESALRYHRDGFEALNDAERFLCCLYLLESEVNNGGFGQWIYSLCPRSAAETPRILREIGATQLATFVTDALQPLANWIGFLPERRRPTPEVLAEYRRGDVSLKWCLRKAERELDADGT
jgi:hypothetical protein